MEAGSRRRWIEVVALAAICLAVYANALGNAYHLDDQYRIVENADLQHVWPPWRHFFDPSTSTSLPTIEQFRPLLPLSLTLTHAIARGVGASTLVVDHLANLGLHFVASVLVLALGRALARRVDPEGPVALVGLGAAILYTVHPVAGVPINYVCARDLLMMQACLLAGLVVYVRMRERGSTPGQWALSLSLVTLSLLAKTDAVVAPAIVGAIELAIFGSSLRKPITWGRAAMFLLPPLAFFGWTEVALDFSDAGQLFIDRAPLEYPLTQARLHVFYYLRNFVWPFEMRVLPQIEPVGPGDALAWVGVAVIVGSWAWAWRIRERDPILAVCIVAYWLAFAPTSWFLPFRYLATDYRQVPSLPWLCIGIAWVLARRLSHRDCVALLGVFAAYCAVASILINRIWIDERTLWGHAIRHGTEAQGHVNYARAVATDDPALAEAHYHQALRMAPTNVFAQINLALLEISQARLDDGIARLELARANAPTWPLTETWLVQGCIAAVRTAEARGLPDNEQLARCRSRIVAASASDS